MREKIERRLARIMTCNKQNPKQNDPIISMTFDDVPRSACTEGADALARFDARATWYVSGQFETAPDHNRFHTSDDLLRLHKAGHEIASHGFGHLNYQQIPNDQIQEDLDQNLSYFNQIGLPKPTNFAYPYGCVSPRVKKICGDYFDSCRGIQTGCNRNNTDMNLLKSAAFYSATLSMDATRALIDDLKDKGGWLIFFSHGVTDEPSEFDCTLKHLSDTLSYAKSLGIPLVTVNEALKKLYLPL